MVYRLLISFILLMQLTFSSYGQNWDIRLLRNINVNRQQSFEGDFKFATNTTYPMAVALPLGALCIGKLTNNQELFENGIKSGVAIVASMSVATVMKYAIDRKRPFVTYPDIQSNETELGHSFPSGHTTAAFATATSASLMFPKWYVIVPSYAWASTVAYSRLYLGAHYPSDVFVGAILGAGTAYISFKAQKWLCKKK
jgi:membrane-associated phospholipid phosphatase